MINKITATILCFALLLIPTAAAQSESQILRLQDDSNPQRRITLFADGRYFVDFGIGALQASGQGTIVFIGDTWHLKHKTPLYTIVIDGDPQSDRGTALLIYAPFGRFVISDRTAN